MIRCYVVDNEEHAIKVLADYIHQTEGLQLVGHELNPVVAQQKITSGEINADITFLDIEMPQLSGIDLASLIQARTHIVFTTAHEHFALKAFDTDVVDYMLKPIAYPRFLNAIRKVQQKIFLQHSGNLPPYIFVQSQAKGKLVNINLSDIIYIVNVQNYVSIVLDGMEHLTYLTMKEMEDILPSDMFLRVHRSYIININRIDYVKSGVINLKNGVPIIIGETYKQNFLSNMNARMIRSRR